MLETTSNGTAATKFSITAGNGTGLPYCQGKINVTSQQNEKLNLKEIVESQVAELKVGSCWTLTPHGHAWRYVKKDTINPFYNSVKQYHQDDGIDWEVPIKKVAKDLNRFLRAYK